MSHFRHSDSQCIKKLIFAFLISITLIGLFGCESKRDTLSISEPEALPGSTLESEDSPVMDFSFPEVESQYYHDALAFLESQQYDKAEEAFFLAIKELNAHALPDQELQVAVVENELGKMYIDLGKYKDSYDYLMKAYITFRDRYGENAEWTLMAKNGLCLYDLAVGNYELAIATLLDIHNQTSADNGKVITANLLGTVYMNQGDYKSAESWYQKAIELAKIMEGYDLSDIYNNCGVLYMHEGNWEKALEYLQEAKQEAQNYGESHVSQVILLDIAQVYANMGDAASANVIINDIIANDSIKFGARSSYVAYDYWAISSLYRIMNDWERQFHSLNSAMDILIEIEGENSHIMSVIYGDLGYYFYQMNDDQLAISYIKKSIEIKKNILEEKSDGARLAYANLGTFLLGEDNMAAFEAYQHEYEIAVYLFGENDTRTGEALMDLANACVETGNLETAGQYIEEGFAIFQKNKVDSGLTAGTAYYIRGKFYAANGQSNSAKNAWYKALDIFEKCEYKHPVTITICWYLGDLCLNEGDYAEAKENYIHCVESMPEIYSYQTESMLYVNNISGTYNEIGFCSYKQGDYDDSLRYYAQGEELLKRYLDENQSDDNKPLYRKLAIIYNNIAAAYEDMGQTADAAEYALISYHIVIEKELDLDGFQKLLQRMERLNVSAD